VRRPEGDVHALRLAERDRAEQRPLQQAEEVGEQQVEAVEHEHCGGEARVRHGNVEEGVVDWGGFRSRVGVAVAHGSHGRSVFAKSQMDLHKCQASSEICQVSKNAKPICKTVGEMFL